jgi:ABC-type transport system involved in Fe-S cluster assembly fused permease/ATPase subunit
MELFLTRRLSTIKRADQIPAIDNGEIVERGKHDELLAKGGQYTNLWRWRQSARGWRL